MQKEASFTNKSLFFFKKKKEEEEKRNVLFALLANQEYVKRTSKWPNTCQSLYTKSGQLTDEATDNLDLWGKSESVKP